MFMCVRVYVSVWGCTCVCEEDPVFSCLTTKELQQNLKEMKQRNRGIKLLFEINSTRIIEDSLTKYVVSGEMLSCSHSTSPRWKITHYG